MPDPLDPGAPGDISPFLKSFSTVKTSMDILRQQRANQRGLTGGGGPVVPELRPSLRVWIQNSSGGILNPGSIVKLGAAVTSFVDDYQYEFRKTPWFIGTTPGAITDAFAILEDPIDYPGGGDFAHGRGVIQGMAVCDVDVTDAGHGYATPTAGDSTKLTSAASGPARIIARDGSGTGTFRCSVKLDESAAGSAAAGFSGAKVFMTSNKSISNGTSDYLHWDSSVDFDDGGWFDAGADTDLTVPSSIPLGSRIAVGCCVQWDYASAGKREIVIVESGTGIYVAAQTIYQPAGSSVGFMTCSGIGTHAGSGTTYKVLVTQTTGGSINVIGNASHVTSFWAKWLK